MKERESSLLVVQHNAAEPEMVTTNLALDLEMG